MSSNGLRLVLAALLLAPVAVLAAPAPTASPFSTAKISDLSGDVKIIPEKDPAASAPAKLQEVFSAPDTLETGRRSRAELKADDGTIARVGSNTAFSLEANSRTINLRHGSILFNSPKGMGGGTIVTNSATATVLGTTIIVAATSDGGFKILVLEGHASITYPGGQVVNLGPGQMTFVLPASAGGSSSGGTSGTASNSGGTSGGTSGGSGAGGTPGPVLNFDLSRQASNSGLVTGFSVTLPSSNLIVDAVNSQQVQISSGQLTQTNQAVVGAVSSTQVVLVDQSTLTAATDSNPGNANNDNSALSGGTSPLSVAVQSSVSFTDSSTFPSSNVFTSPQTFSASQLGIPDGLIKNNVLQITGVIAGDIAVGGNVDVSQLDGLPEADFLAANTHTFTFSSNTTFTGLSTTGKLALYSAGSFVIPDNSTITYYPTDTGNTFDSEENPSNDFDDFHIVNFEIGSIGTMSLQGVTVRNASGNVELDTLLGNLSINATNVIAGQDEVDSDGASEVRIESRKGAVSITGNSALVADDYGNIYVRSGSDVNIQNSTLEFGAFSNGNLTISAQGNATLSNATIKASYANITGGAMASVTGGSFANSTSLEIGAATVNLGNVDFSDSTNLELWSANGDYNVVSGNNVAVAGDVNFFGNVTYGGTDITEFIDDGVNLGITADNSGVQAALATTLTLPAVSVPDNLIFERVMFTPANLAPYVSTRVGDSFIFQGGLIVGNLVLNGDAMVDASNAVLAGNFKINASSNLDIVNGTELSLYVLSGFTATPNTTLTANFSEAEGNSDLFVQSFSSFSLSHAAIDNPSGNIDLNALEDNDPAISLNAVSLVAGNGIDIMSLGDGNVAIVNSSLAAGSNGQISINSTSDQSAISILSSNLSAGDGINLGQGYDSFGGDIAVTIQSSELDSGNSTLNMTGGDFSITNSSLQSQGGIYFSSQGGVTVDTSDIYTGNSSEESLDLYANQVSISNSDIDTTGSLYVSSGNGSLLVSNSSLSGDNYVDLESSNGGLITVQSSNLTSNNNIYISSNLSTDNGTLGDLHIQASNITSSSSYIDLYGGSTLAVAGNSSIAANSSLSLTGDAVTVQDSVLQSGTDNNGTNGYVSINGGHIVTVVNSKIVAETVNLSAQDIANSTLNVSKLNLDSATSISMSARTITLSNVNFPSGSSVNLSSQNGMLAPNPNTNAVPIVGYVNFVTNVLYGGQPAQNFVPTSVGGSSSNPRAPIQISTLSEH